MNTFISSNQAVLISTLANSLTVTSGAKEGRGFEQGNAQLEACPPHVSTLGNACTATPMVRIHRSTSEILNFAIRDGAWNFNLRIFCSLSVKSGVPGNQTHIEAAVLTDNSMIVILARRSAGSSPNSHARTRIPTSGSSTEICAIPESTDSFWFSEDQSTRIRGADQHKFHAGGPIHR